MKTSHLCCIPSLCGLLPMYNAVVTGGDVVWNRLQEDASIPETHRKSATMSANWERGTSFQQRFPPPAAEHIHRFLSIY